MSNLHHLLGVIALLATQASAVDLSRDLQFSTNNPYTVSLGFNVYTVSKNTTHIQIVSDDENYRPCTIAQDSERDSINGRIKAVALGTKKIIVYGIHHTNEVHTVKFVHHTILLIDPFSCNSKFIEGAGHDKIPTHFPATKAEIVPLSSSKFDVFYLGPQNCAPCRFNTAGKKITLDKQVKSDLSRLANFFVRTLPHSGWYAYAIVYGNGSAALQVLDVDFKLINKQLLKNTIFDLTTAHIDATSYIGLTYNTADSPYKFFYALYDSTLRQKFERPLGSLDCNHLGLGSQVNIDSQGNSYVSSLQMSSEEGHTKVTLVVYDFKGKKIGESNELAVISTGGYEIQTLIIKDREYCIVVHEFDDPHDVTRVKCINITNYRF